MKIRKGFVSNSSSSSFVCDVCGNIEVGYDMSLQDFEMSRCDNGHEFCDSHITRDVQLTIEQKVEKLKRLYSYSEGYLKKIEVNENDEDEIDNMYQNVISDVGISSESCPICQLDSIRDIDLNRYLLTKYSLKREEVEGEIRESFDDYNKLREFFKS